MTTISKPMHGKIIYCAFIPKQVIFTVTPDSSSANFSSILNKISMSKSVNAMKVTFDQNIILNMKDWCFRVFQYEKLTSFKFFTDF